MDLNGAPRLHREADEMRTATINASVGPNYNVVSPAVETNFISRFDHCQRAWARQLAVFLRRDRQYFLPSQIQNVQFAVVAKAKAVSAGGKF